MEELGEIIRTAEGYFPDSKALLGSVCSADKEKRTLKIILEPSNTETGWCRVTKGSFTEEIGTEVLVLSVGQAYGQYLVCGIIDKPE